ncbi:MAG: polysaccharide deacetylase family protein [Thermodesulfobacteriota bacterium]
MNLTRREFLKISAGTFFSSLLMRKESPTFPDKIPILLYHDISDSFKDDYTISPSQFAAQMEWLYSEGYQTLFFKEIDHFLLKGYKKIALITFDDGYASFMDFAFPLLQTYHFKATMNIIGEKVGTFITLGGNRPTLSWEEYHYLLRSGWVDLGCHTYSLHKQRGVLSVSEAHLRRDLEKFQEVIKREIGKELEILAWPYGQFNEKSIDVSRDLGFKYFLTSTEGFFQKSFGWDRIPRLNINHKIDLVSFKQYVGWGGT